MAATLLAVPNFSEGRDEARIDAIAAALAGAAAPGHDVAVPGTTATVLDRHSDADHNRTVFTLAGSPPDLVDALAAGAVAAATTIDMSAHEGVHPAVGALDVCPLVWLDPDEREVAALAAREAGARIGALGIPVFFYGDLATGPDRVERAYFRNGGLAELWLRMDGGELHPDCGPDLPHRTAGVTLATARPPLAAFNVELDSDNLEVARAVAAGLRESGGGPEGVRAIGLPLSFGRAQVSTNVHDPFAVPLGEIVDRVRALAAPLGARPVEAELVGLIPAAALAGYPADVPIRDFDPASRVIERRLAATP